MPSVFRKAVRWFAWVVSISQSLLRPPDLHDLDQVALAKQNIGRGTGWDFQQLEDLKSLGRVGWWYDWGPAGNQQAMEYSLQHDIEFVPMQWGKWGIEDLAKDISPSAKHLLGMNEPGHKQQANLSPAEAAALWPVMEEVARVMNLKLGTPSPAPCGADCVRSSPFQWFDEFFEACKGCHFDFLATHLYSCNAETLQRYINECKKYNLPIWLTEFACPNGAEGPLERQIAYMRDALRLLDRDKGVERCAWFAPRTGGNWLGRSASLLQPDSPELTELGKLYISESSKSPWQQHDGHQLLLQAGSAVLADLELGQLHLSGNHRLALQQNIEDRRSWTDVCSPCFEQNKARLPGLNATMHQMCTDCGFWGV